MNVRVCPVCGSAKIDKVRSVGSDSDVACANCGWSGLEKGLITAGFDGALPSADFVAALAIAQDVSVDYMRLLARHAGFSIGVALVQSGVIGVKDEKSMARLIRAACKGAHKATLDEIEKMQEELRDGQRSNIS